MESDVVFENNMHSAKIEETKRRLVGLWFYSILRPAGPRCAYLCSGLMLCENKAHSNATPWDSLWTSIQRRTSWF
jgi:hypothetical protein